MMNSDEPCFLAIGTEVSAKYKGAFCEAKITKIISKFVKCQIQFLNGISTFVTDQEVTGQLKVGATVEIKRKDKKDLVKATIQKIQDYSQYRVEFGDGDVACLKRTRLCLKSESSSATLDQFSSGKSPLRTDLIQGRRSRKRKISFGESRKEENLVMEEKCIGKILCVENNVNKKVRDNWFPGLIVAPTLQSSVRTNAVDYHLVRSFKDGKYYSVPRRESTEFTKEIGARVENHTLKIAVEKAMFFMENDELPPHWDRDLLFGIDKLCIATNNEAYDGNKSDRESIEEKDHFVAQLFKFMDERGTPLNEAPVINGKDVDLYKLFKIVYNYGGYKKVDKDQQWIFVSMKAGHGKQSDSVRDCYQKYFYSFEKFYRKLGCTMLSYPKGTSSHSRFSRSIISVRNFKTKKETKSAKKEKVAVNSADTSMKKKRPIKEEMKTFVNVMTPFKKSKIGASITQQDTFNKGKYDEQKLTQSKTKDLLHNKSRKISVSSYLNDSSLVQLAQTRHLVEKQYKTKQNRDGFEKITVRKKKSEKEKITKSNYSIPTYVSINDKPFDKDTPLIVGDHLLVYIKNKETCQAKVLKVDNIGGVMKYFIHYVGYNSRHDVWINAIELSQTIKDPEIEPEGNNDDDVDSSTISSLENTEKKKNARNKKKKATLNNPSIVKINAEPFDKDSSVIVEDNLTVHHGDKQHPTYNAKPTNLIPKKVLSTTGKTRESATPVINSQLKKSPFSSTQLTRTCTLTNYPEYIIDCSNKEVSHKTTAKHEPDTDIKIEPLPKPCVLEMQCNRFEEVDICEQFEVVEQNGSMISLVPNSYNTFSFDNIGLNTNENLTNIDEIKDSTHHSQSNTKSYNSQNLMVSDAIVDASHIKEIELCSQDHTCHVVEQNESMIALVPNYYNTFSFDNIGLNTNENLTNIDEIKDSIHHNQSNTKSYNSQNLMVSDAIVDASYKKEIELYSQYDTCHVVEQNRSIIPFMQHINTTYSFDNVESNVDENLIIINKTNNSIYHRKSENESNSYQNVMISDGIVDTSHIKEIELNSQNYKCLEVSVSGIEYEVLDLCMRPLESPLHNIFSLPKPNYDNNIIVKKYDDESKLAINKNDTVETFYQMDNTVNHLNQNNNTNENSKNLASATKCFFEFFIYKPTNNDKPRKDDYEIKKVKHLYENEKTMELPELQCRNVIVDKVIFNKALVEINCKHAVSDTFKSKEFIDLTHQPGTSKDNFDKNNTISNEKNDFFVIRQAAKNINSDTIAPKRNNRYFDQKMLSTFENHMPGTSKSFNNIKEEKILKRKKVLMKEWEKFTALKEMDSEIPSTLMHQPTEKKIGGAIFDQKHSKYLPEISGKNVCINVNEPLVAEPIIVNPESIIIKPEPTRELEKIVKPPGNPKPKHRIINLIQSSTHSKSSSNTAPIPSVTQVEK